MWPWPVDFFVQCLPSQNAHTESWVLSVKNIHMTLLALCRAPTESVAHTESWMLSVAWLLSAAWGGVCNRGAEPAAST